MMCGVCGRCVLCALLAFPRALAVLRALSRRAVAPLRWAWCHRAVGFSQLSISFFPTMVTLVWEGGRPGGAPPASYGVQPF